MKRTVPVWVLVASFLASGTAHAQGGKAPAQPPPAPEAPAGSNVNPQVKQLFDEGVKAADKGQWEKARSLFAEAFKLDARPKIAANLGRAELKLGKARDAAEHLDYFLREDKVADAEERQAVQEVLDEAAAKIGTLRVKVDVEGAEVFVDDRSVGKSPLGGSIYLDPGSYTVEARLAGKTPAGQKVALGAGAKLDVDLKLQPPETVPCTKDQKVISTEEPGWRKPVIYSSIGLAVAGVGVGIGFSVAAAMKAGEYDDEMARLRAETSTANRLCPLGMTDPRCRTMVELGETQNTYAYIARAGFVVGGLATAGAVVVGLMKSKTTTKIEETKCKDVAVAPTLSGIVVSGCF